MRRVTVVGTPVPAGAAELVASATLLVGAARHLSTVDGPAERIVLGEVPAAVSRIAGHDGSAVVLASGDPGFFGIVRALRAAGLDVEVWPAPSSVAVAFARLGLPWDDALVVSAHGRALRPAVNACRAHRKVAVLTGPGAGPAELGSALRDLSRRLVVAERLGSPDERITEITPGEAAAARWREPNVVLVLAAADPAPPVPLVGPADPAALVPPVPLGDPADPAALVPLVAPAAIWLAGSQPGPAGWALPEAAFEHRDSMITKAEVRALVLARLGPRVGDLVWDIGTGSGAVAIECARFGAAVVAVERDPAAGAMVRANAAAHHVELCLVEATAPECLSWLPDPDAVYVGGGGLDVLAACAARRPARLVAGFAAVERVGPALSALHAAGYRVHGVQVQANRLVALPDGAHRLAATNPVHLVSGVLT